LLVGDAVGAKGGMFGVTFNDVTDTWQSCHVGIFNGRFATTFNGVNDNGDIVVFYVNASRNTIGLLAAPRRRDRPNRLGQNCAIPRPRVEARREAASKDVEARANVAASWNILRVPTFWMRLRSP
jgi:hypothetical protein